jgi:pimeloyl-ACP methyl ester carboxylesterase
MRRRSYRPLLPVPVVSQTTLAYPVERMENEESIMKNPWQRTTAGLAGLLILAGCATPIGVNRVGMDRAYEQINASTLTGPLLSDDTRLVLARYDLGEVAERAPDAAVMRLHEQACRDPRRDILFALTEVCYRAGQHYEKSTWTKLHRQGELVTLRGARAARGYYLSAAIYSYLYLFGAGGEPPPAALDRRFRMACDLYNRGLAKALKSDTSQAVELQARTIRLPMGVVTMESTRPGFRWTESQFHEFFAADEYLVRGLTHRTRHPGLGAPLIGIPDRAAFGDQWPPYYTEGLRVPATAFLRVTGTVGDMTAGDLKVALELHSPYRSTTVQVNDQELPLEIDMTAPLAYGLEKGAVWHTELAQFLSGRQLIKSRIYLPQPYAPGRIPVVFVHGTTGSPARWAEMFNTLQADPVLRPRCQFWYFIYNSGQPILYSAMLLREGLDQLTQELDPAGADAALRQMVVIGHSQGGLLTRLVASSTGGKVWGGLALDELKLRESDRALLRRAMMFEPSPYVRRAVFISTPHRGSYRISGLLEKLTRRLLALPQDLVGVGASLVTGGGESLPAQLRRGVPTSITNMEPGSPFVKTLAACPTGPNIKLNSIIAVRPGLPVATGNDGVVAYSSAHLDPAESEFIVRWGHSCQGHPLVIEEVRRILLAQLALAPEAR